ncbi:SprT-like domain-containing protein [Clostridium haemolyticum]|uniref:SprT-like domain-containing protein n=1 Tax=Clostridium haemolyticum NCTC 9693 TaxID=1443114 RepID=A0ABR4TB55_CLOHA|nr:SprT-like domain-containing protein [Clostridium haemolyticum]KEI14049.1 hypothetical protein Z960_p0048 [Clostridium haemolyticum NCTC 9693]
MDKIIRELHKAYDIFNERKFNGQLLPCVITIQSQQKSKSKQVLGWCSCEPWWCEKIGDKENYMYEINIVADFLNRTYEEIMETFLHELVHISCNFKGVISASSRGYHNENFKEEAERIGLNVEKVSRIGWSMTSLSESLLQEVRDLEIDQSVFCLSKVVVPKEKKPRKPAVKYKYRCPNCHREVVSKESGIGIKCLYCNTDFEELEDKNKEDKENLQN